jgi:dephospho-CoA kinase
VGITGGIATGKSTFVRALLTQLPGVCFDADQCSRELMETDPVVHAEIQQAFGSDVLGDGGRPDRLKIRKVVFESAKKRQELEAILHPRIRARWVALADEHRRQGSWLLVDIPLLFETGAEMHCDQTVVVACSRSVQENRLLDVRRLSADLAQRIIDAQLDLGTKIQKAHHVIWNDSTFSCLERQAALLAGWFRQCYGSRF